MRSANLSSTKPAISSGYCVPSRTPAPLVVGGTSRLVGFTVFDVSVFVSTLSTYTAMFLD